MNDQLLTLNRTSRCIS